MPTIDVAMARSLRGGVWGSIRDSLARSVAANLARRDIVDSAKGKVSDVQKAFSSWDNCMDVVWCKWPVIGVIVIGSIIIISIVWCIIRCCCCGVSCCCGCCQCLKCCGDCCGCCDPPGTKNKHKNLEDPYPPQPNHGYRSEAPMDPSISPFAPRANYPENNHSNQFAGAYQTGVTQPGKTRPGAPQYAEFDTSKNRGGEDSLPEMPSWENAATKKVMVQEEEVEMKNLRKSPAPEQQLGAMNNIQSGRSSPMSHHERNPYDQQQGNQSPYLGGNQQPSHYSPINNNGYGYNSNTPSNGYGVSQSYANSTPAVAAVGSGRHTPVNGYGASQSYSNHTPAAEVDGSGRHTPVHGYGANQPYANHTQAVEVDGSGRNTPVNGYGVNGYGANRSYANHTQELAAVGSGRSTPVNGYGVNQPYANHTPAVATVDSGRDAPVELQGSDSYVSMPSPAIKPAQTTYYEAPGDSVHSPSFPPHNDNSSHDNYRRATPGPAYGTDPYARQSPAPGPRQTPGPHQDAYGYGQSARLSPAPTNDYAYNQARRTPGPMNDFDRAFSPAPDRQYGAASPRPLARPAPHRIYDNEPPQAPISNNAGFDFNSGYARPGQSPTTEAYPGYKAYQP